jgi:metal-dependent amidase/aminoacylase/carboxypeptidase family protein
MNPSLLPTIDASASRWLDEVIALRREIHAHPELAFEERETARRVQAFLTARRIPFRSDIGGTGIVAMLEGRKPGPTVAIRADMDALPMGEPEGLPYA